MNEKNARELIFPNMKESGLYGRSLFACLQKETQPTHCTELAASWQSHHLLQAEGFVTGLLYKIALGLL